MQRAVSNSTSVPPISDVNTEWLNRVIVISVPALTGLLLLALAAFGLVRCRTYVRRQRRRRAVDDSDYDPSSVEAAQVPPQFFFRDPTRALAAAARAQQRRSSGKGLAFASRYSEGSDAFPDNYRSYYGGSGCDSQPGSESSEVNLQRVTLVEEIGSGCFTKVFVAMLAKKSREKDFAVQVAVKQLQGEKKLIFLAAPDAVTQKYFSQGGSCFCTRGDCR